jgi:hypothetical protein
VIRTIHVQAGSPNTRQRVVLDGREYVLDLRWSQREERWYLDLYDAIGRLLAGSVKLVVNWPLLYKLRGLEDALPPGELFAISASAAPQDPGLDELGDSVQLVYADSSDVAEAAA